MGRQTKVYEFSFSVSNAISVDLEQKVDARALGTGCLRMTRSVVLVRRLFRPHFNLERRGKVRSRNTKFSGGSHFRCKESDLLTLCNLSKAFGCISHKLFF